MYIFIYAHIHIYKYIIMYLHLSLWIVGLIDEEIELKGAMVSIWGSWFVCLRFLSSPFRGLEVLFVGVGFVFWARVCFVGGRETQRDDGGDARERESKRER